ncbi:MAG: hypothetical protein ACKOAK_00905 [Ignavibacteria bacterium]
MEENTTFPVPLWAAWVINIVSWIIFVTTDIHVLEIIMGVACLVAAFIAFKHNGWYLLFVSILDAVWMFSWGFELDLFKSLI